MHQRVIPIHRPLAMAPPARKAAPAAPSPRVLLVSPPWTSLNEPSLGLGLLRAVLDRHGVASRVLHLNLFALDWLRGDTYDALADVYGLNDFLFSGILDPVVTPAQRRLIFEEFFLYQLGHAWRRHAGSVELKPFVPKVDDRIRASIEASVLDLLASDGRERTAA